MSRPLCVVGIGSPHGDDAVGLETVQRLRHDIEWGQGIDFHAVDSGQRLLDLLDGQNGLILIDGLKREGAIPGTIHRLTWPDARIEALGTRSTHSFGAAQALQLAAALDILPKQIAIYAMEISSAAPGGELSPNVAAALPELVKRVRAEIESMCNGPNASEVAFPL